jgi:wingless-type MMTV integration site family protein 10
MIEESNLGSGGSTPLVVVQEGRGRGRGRRKKKKKRRRRPKPKELATSLLYYEKSPNFCERDPGLEVPGTVGRQCHRSGRGVDSCSSMCCGRGYNIVRRRTPDRCDCKFQWCCIVTCKNCTKDEWITVCK